MESVLTLVGASSAHFLLDDGEQDLRYLAFAPLLVLYKVPTLAGMEKEELKGLIDKAKELIALI